MKVRLIAATQPVATETQEFGSDLKEFIAFCARVSNPSNQMNHETSERLLNYLAKHQHWSPFEMASATMEIETTRDIARQILRHRSFSFQEFSQRYADPTGDLGFVTREARLQDEKNRQNSIEVDDARLEDRWELIQKDVIQSATEAYNWAIQNGIAKEQARAVLPEGLTVSRMYMAGTIRSWMHYAVLRAGVETQKEHREIALAVAKAISEIYPIEV